MVKYSERERTVKQVTVSHVVENARVYLDARGHQNVGICTDDLRYRDRDQLMTIEEGNRLMEAIVDTSLYYAGR